MADEVEVVAEVQLYSIITIQIVFRELSLDLPLLEA